MKKVVVKKIWSNQSGEQTFSYTKDAPMGHIKRHIASEVSYARKGQSSVMSSGGKVEDLKVSLVSTEGLTDTEKTDLKTFLEKL